MSKMTNDIVIRATDKASKKLRGTARAANSLGTSLKNVVKLGAAYFGGRAIFGFAKSSAEAFMVQEDAVNSLRASLDGLGSAAQLPDMAAFAAQIQQVTTHGDEATMQLMSLGASMGRMSGETLKAATTAAIGFSKSLGVDTKTAMTLVSKAAAGNFSTFSRYGIQLDANLSAQEKFQAVLAAGNEGFKLAKAETETTSGALKQLDNAWGDLKETIGGAITSVFPNIVANIKSVETALTNWQLKLDIICTEATLGIISFWEDIKHYFGTTIPTLLGWLGDNWKNIFTDMFNATGTIISNMSENLINFFGAVWGWLKGDGFNFEWTALTEGFESSLTELPKIAERELSALETGMAKELNQMYAELGKATSDKPGPTVDTAGTTMPGALGKDKATAKASQGLAAKETRFLSVSLQKNRDPAIESLATQKAMLKTQQAQLAEQKKANARKQQPQTQTAQLTGIAVTSMA